VLYMSGSPVTTTFHFVCDFCQAANDYRHSHAAGIRPYLVTRRCETCHKVNHFAHLLGTVETGSELDPATAGPADLLMRVEEE